MDKVRIIYLSFFFFLYSVLELQASVVVKQFRRGEEIKVFSILPSERGLAKPYQVLRSTPYILDEGPKSSDFLYEEILFQNQASFLEAYQDFETTFENESYEHIEGAEVRTIILQGPSKNRINLTIVGDGYTSDEKEKFFSDAARISKDFFEAQAFSSYLPLFNVYAVFVPSNESGISDIYKKDTALGLYRDPPGSKRAIMPGKHRAIEAAIALAPAADFPILIANDDFYGGLGGRYAISTRSVLSGSIVLRHELGHNFGDVGEEYDGGYVYRGANSSSQRGTHWSRWVDGDIEVYDSKFLMGEYVWQDLHEHPFSQSFNVPSASEVGPYQTVIRLSGVGWAGPEDVIASIDGQIIPYEGVFTPDRSFFDVRPLLSLSPGKHNLQIRQANDDHPRTLAYVQIIANKSDHDYTLKKIAAFATFNDGGSFAGYRPTDDSCLMRNMRSTFFCAVDIENMWLRFLNRIDLIDAVEVTADHHVKLISPKLKNMEVHWYRFEHGDEVELDEFRDQTEWASGNLAGAFRVRLIFKTPEVRAYSSRFKAQKDFRL